MSEKSRSWVFDGPMPVESYVPDSEQKGHHHKKNGKYGIHMGTLKDDSRMANDETNEPVKNSAKKGKVTGWLTLCVFVVTFASSVQFGYNIACISGPAPHIRQFINESQYERRGFRFEEGVASMIWTVTEACFRFGGAIGCQMGAQLSLKLGRRNGLLVQNAITLIGSVMLGVTQLANAWEMLLVGRLIVGLGTGMSMTLVPLYLTEISPTNHRGAIGAVHYLMIAVGLLVAQGITFFPLNNKYLWSLGLALGGVFGAIGLLTIPFFPETPRYLAITRNADDEAEIVLQKLRGLDADITAELDEIRTERHLERKRDISGLISTILCRAPGWKMPVFLGMVLLISQQLSGITAFTFNAMETWRDTGAGEDEIYFLIIGSDAMIIIASIIPIFLADSYGRRRLLVYGFCFCVLFQSTLTVSVNMHINNGLNWSKWGVLMSIYGFVISFSLGPGSMPFVVIPEIFTQEPRTYAVAVTNQSYWLASFLMSFIYPLILESLGSFTFIVFMLITIVPVCLTYKYLPETRRNTFVENAALFLPRDEDDNHL